MTAVRVRADGVVDLADGRKLPIRVGDWMIANGPTVLNVVGPGDLSNHYEVIQEGALSVSPEACRQLRDRLGPGTTNTSEALVAAVERLCVITVQGVKVEFTPGQMDELKFRAGKRGHTLQQEINACVDRIRDELFWRAPTQPQGGA